jgi:hypothetical protein
LTPNHVPRRAEIAQCPRVVLCAVRSSPMSCRSASNVSSHSTEALRTVGTSRHCRSTRLLRVRRMRHHDFTVQPGAAIRLSNDTSPA